MSLDSQETEKSSSRQHHENKIEPSANTQCKVFCFIFHFFYIVYCYCAVAERLKGDFREQSLNFSNNSIEFEAELNLQILLGGSTQRFKASCGAEWGQLGAELCT